MGKQPSDRVQREQMERLISDVQTAWLEGRDADVSNLVDAGLRDPKRFAWALTRYVADERVLLLLSIQRALVGAVSPSLHGVCAELRSKTILLTFYVAAEATEDELEDLRAVGTEVIGDFTDSFQIDERFTEVTDLSQPLPTAGTWVFLQSGFATA